MKKRFISVMLVMLMAMSTFGTFVFAEDPIAEPESSEEAVLTVDEEAEETAEPAEEVTEEATEAEEVTEEEALPEEEATEEAAEEEETVVVEPEEDLMAAETLPVTATYVKNKNSYIDVAWTLEDGVTATSVTIKAFKDGAAEPFKTVTVKEPATTKSYTFTGNTKGTYTYEVTVKGKRKGADKAETFKGTSNEVASPGAILGFATYSAYKRVVIEWNKPAAGETPDRYEIYCDGKLVRTYDDAMPSSPFDNAKKYYYYVQHPDDPDKFVNGKEASLQHSYYIKAVYGDTEVKTAVKKDTVTLPFKIKLTFKSGQSGTLTSHDGKNKKFKYSGGKVVYATSFARGQYHFYNNGNLFYVNYTRVSPKATLNGRGKWNYSAREAQYFINTLGSYGKSSSNRLIYVNLYTQHLYVACKTKGKFVVKNLSYKGKKFRDWEISSGKPTTPSPWGLGLKYGGKLVNIYTHSRKVNGHTTNFWNFYHSETALHGRADNQGYGAPFSHGCIRNPDYRASFILNVIPLKTRVVIY